MSDYIPGPWWVDRDIIYGDYQDGTSVSVASVLNVAFPYGRRAGKSTQANARLIAAAPDLLVALMLAKDMMIANDLSLPNTFEVIDEALAKARGEI